MADRVRLLISSKTRKGINIAGGVFLVIRKFKKRYAFIGIRFDD
jgi:hypothetical protein